MCQWLPWPLASVTLSELVGAPILPELSEHLASSYSHEHVGALVSASVSFVAVDQSQR
jgi:hypothetical protein